MEEPNITRIQTVGSADGCGQAPERQLTSIREEFIGMRGLELYREWVDAGKPRRATA